MITNNHVLIAAAVIALSACQPETPEGENETDPFVDLMSSTDATFFLSSMDQAIQSMTMKAVAHNISAIGDFDFYRGAYLNTTTSVECDEGNEAVTVVYEDNSIPVEGGLDQVEFMRITHATETECKDVFGGSFTAYTGSIISDIDWGTQENDLWLEFESDTSWQGSFEIQDEYDNSNWLINLTGFNAILSRTEQQLSSEVGLLLNIEASVTYKDSMGNSKTASFVVSSAQAIPLIASWSTTTVSTSQTYIDPELSERFGNGAVYSVDINQGDQVIVVSTTPDGTSFTVNGTEL